MGLSAITLVPSILALVALTTDSFSEPHCLMMAMATANRGTRPAGGSRRSLRSIARPDIPAQASRPIAADRRSRSRPAAGSPPQVDRFSQVTVRTNRYSVPARLIGRRVRVLLHASHLVVYDGNAEVAQHERLPGKSAARLDPDHYLEAWVRKPGALPGSTALEQAGRFHAEPVLVRIDEPD